MQISIEQTRERLWQQFGKENRVAIQDTIAVILLAALPFMVMWALWSPNPADRAILVGDALVGGYPTRVYVHRLLMDGQIPLWNPYQLGGMPLLADIQVAVYYLPNLLLDLIFWGQDITLEGFEALIIGHYAIGALFMYGYLRQQQIQPVAALIGAIAFEFNGFFIGHRGHYSMLSVVVWVPGIMWLLDRAWSEAKGWRRLGWSVGAGLLLSQLFMGGHPQLAFYSGLFLMAYFLFRWLPALKQLSAWWQLDLKGKWYHSVMQTAVSFGVAGVLALTIAMIALLPMAELLTRSIRSELSYTFSVQYPLMPRNMINLVMPQFLDWSGTEFRIYAGVFTLVLMTVGLLVPEKPRPIRYFFTVMLLVSTLMAMGGFTAIHGWLYRFVPGFDSVRVTARLFYFSNFSIAVLAAMGAEIILRPLRKREKERLVKILHNSRAILLLLSLVAIVCYMLLTWYYQPADDTFYFYEALFIPIQGDSQYLFLTQIMNGFMLFVTFLLLSLLWLWLRAYKRPNVVLLSITAVLLMTIDITTFATEHDVAQVPDFSQAALEGFAVRTLAPWEAQEQARLIEQLTSLSPIERIDNTAGILPDNYSQVWKANFATGYNVLDLQERFEIQTQWPVLDDSLRWDLLNVSTILTAADNPEPPEENAQLLLENSRGKVWQRAESPAFAHFSSSLRPANESLTINGLLVSTDNPFDQPVVNWNEQSAAAASQVLSTPNSADLFRIGETGVIAPVNMSLLAGGPQSYSGVVVDGETLSLGERGLNVVSLDPTTGELIQARAFDTYLGGTENERLAAFLNALPNGTIVAIVTYDDGLSNLEESGLNALKQLGAIADLTTTPGQTYALVGVKGAPSGTAVEQVGVEPLLIDIGIGAEEMRAGTFQHQVLQYEQERITMAVANSEPGLLTITEASFPGWRAYVNGEETAVLQVNGMLRGVLLPEMAANRPHEVTFVYDPLSVRLGIFLSLVGLLGATVLLAASIWYSFGQQPRHQPTQAS